MKMKTSNIILISVIVVLYTIIIGSFGAFGDTIQNALFFFYKNVLPYIGLAFGYFLSIFVPIRVIQALNRNKERNEEIAKEQNLTQRVVDEKELQKNILNLLTNEDTI